MNSTLPPSGMIVETSRGPSLADRRMTVYVILDHLKNGCEREFIKEHLLLSDEQLDAALAYIEQHREQVERDYAEILRDSDEKRERYEKLYRERSRYSQNLSTEERAVLMRRDLNSKRNASDAHDAFFPTAALPNPPALCAAPFRKGGI